MWGWVSLRKGRCRLLQLLLPVTSGAAPGAGRNVCVDRQGKAMKAADITGDRGVKTGMPG